MREGGQEKSGKGEREGGEREKHWHVVPLIDTFIGWFLYVPWLGIQPTTLAYWVSALTTELHGQGEENLYSFQVVFRQCTHYSPIFFKQRRKRSCRKNKISGKISIQNMVMSFIKGGLQCIFITNIYNIWVFSSMLSTVVNINYFT